MEKKKRFTDLSVEKIDPVDGRRLEVFDTLTPGLAVRITDGRREKLVGDVPRGGLGDGRQPGAGSSGRFVGLGYSLAERQRF